MNMHQRTTLLYRILSDYHTILINNKKYIVRRPTQDILYKAVLEYDNTVSCNKFNGWMSTQDCIDHLIKIGHWTLDGDQKIKNINKFVEDQKVALYQNAVNLDEVKSIRRNLKQANVILNELYGIKHSLDSFTLAGTAELIQTNYILAHTIELPKEQYLSYSFLNLIKIELSKLQVTQEEIRELARTDPWRSYCGIADNCFSKSVIELDSDKRSLLMYAKMYDNIHNHPECPSDDVINDDDMLDGWMILQKRTSNDKQKENKAEGTVGGLSSKYQNSTEIFLPAKETKQLEAIDKLNSTKAKMVRKQRKQMMDQQGQVGVGKLPDEVLAQRSQAIQEFKNHK